MEKCHKNLLEDSHNNDEQETKKRKASSKTSYFARKPSELTRKYTEGGEQNHLSLLVAMWTAKSLQPFVVCEDEGLQELIDLISQAGKGLKMPSRNTNKANIDWWTGTLRSRLKETLARKWTKFSATTNLWTTRTMDAVMAVTIHFLDR